MVGLALLGLYNCRQDKAWGWGSARLGLVPLGSVLGSVSVRLVPLGLAPLAPLVPLEPLPPAEALALGPGP